VIFRHYKYHSLKDINGKTMAETKGEAEEVCKGGKFHRIGDSVRKNERKICAPFCPQRRLTNPDYYLDWDNKETKQTI